MNPPSQKLPPKRKAARPTPGAKVDTSRASWQLQEAKNRFSEVVERALHEGPQIITRHGKPVVRVVSQEQFEKLSGFDKPLGTWLRESPLAEVELEFVRRQDRPRRGAL